LALYKYFIDIDIDIQSLFRVCEKVAWSMFYGNLGLPELDKIQTINVLQMSVYCVSSMD